MKKTCHICKEEQEKTITNITIAKPGEPLLLINTCDTCTEQIKKYLLEND